MGKFLRNIKEYFKGVKISILACTPELTHKKISGQRFKKSAIFKLIYILAVMLYETEKEGYGNCQPLRI